MPLKVSSEVFKETLWYCFQNPDNDASELFKITEPFLWFWVSNLENPKPNIHVISLLRLLDHEPEKALTALAAWVEGIKETHTLLEELQMLLLQELREMKYWPTQARPVMIEYIVAMGLKRRIKDKIKLYKPNNDIVSSLSEPPPIETDWLFLENIKTYPWYLYLIDCFYRGYNIPTISDMTHVLDETIRNDMRNICQLFLTDKQLLVKQEANKALIKKS